VGTKNNFKFVQFLYKNQRLSSKVTMMVEEDTIEGPSQKRATEECRVNLVMITLVNLVMITLLLTPLLTERNLLSWLMRNKLKLKRFPLGRNLEYFGIFHEIKLKLKHVRTKAWVLPTKCNYTITGNIFQKIPSGQKPVQIPQNNVRAKVIRTCLNRSLVTGFDDLTRVLSLKN